MHVCQKYMTDYKTAIILSARLTPYGELDEQMLQRVNAGISKYNARQVSSLTMTAGQAQRKIPFSHASRMKKYALEQGVTAKAIITEENALDTVGKAAFCLRDIIMPKNWADFTVISSGYHMARVETIFSLLYGKEFNIQYISVTSTMDYNARTLKGELKKISDIVKIWRDVRPGNTDSIMELLFATHPLYKGGQDAFRTKVSFGE
jgi:uncharacterized SAM-binding protein YcdF (DUF218 family)